jgi:hypothetical protein
MSRLLPASLQIQTAAGLLVVVLALALGAGGACGSSSNDAGSGTAGGGGSAGTAGRGGGGASATGGAGGGVGSGAMGGSGAGGIAGEGDGGATVAGGRSGSSGTGGNAGSGGTGSGTGGSAGRGGTGGRAGGDGGVGGRGGAGGNAGTGGGRGGTAGASGAGGRGTGGGGGAAGSGGGGSGGGAGSSATVRDDFERAALGSNWTIVYPASGTQVQIIGNSDLGMAPGPEGFFLANWTGSTFAADQWSEAVIPADAAAGWAYQPYVRWRASDRARYGFGLDNDPGQTQYYNKWYLKYDGVAGSETRMFGLADNMTGRQPGPGDTLRVEIRGYTLYGYWNGQLMTTAADTAANRIANGVPGLAARVANGNQAITQPAKVWESWAGGSLSP